MPVHVGGGGERSRVETTIGKMMKEGKKGKNKGKGGKSQGGSTERRRGQWV